MKLKAILVFVFWVASYGLFQFCQRNISDAKPTTWQEGWQDENTFLVKLTLFENCRIADATPLAKKRLAELLMGTGCGWHTNSEECMQKRGKPILALIEQSHKKSKITSRREGGCDVIFFYTKAGFKRALDALER